jgi:hypothetical protein
LTLIIDFQKGLKTMTELIRIGQGFFEDLATKPETEARLLVDSRLTEQEFAAKHADTILDHYMSTFSFDFLREDAEFFAAAIWHYLRARPPRPESDRRHGLQGRPEGELARCRLLVPGSLTCALPGITEEHAPVWRTVGCPFTVSSRALNTIVKIRA